MSKILAKYSTLMKNLEKEREERWHSMRPISTHWELIKTMNPIKSAFTTVKIRR
ncbi:MAG: hypothetical protein ACTS85_00250 [Arsenophonus sp. NC-PG7-MAG3]